MKKKHLFAIAISLLTLLVFLIALRTTTGFTLSKKEKVARLFEKAKDYHIHNQLSQAMETFTKLLEIDPMHEDARIMLGVILVNLSRYKDAEAEFMTILKNNPDNFRAHGFLGSLYARLGDYTNALKHCNKDLELDQRSTVRIAIAEVYTAQNKLKEAEEILDAHIQYWPNDPEGYLSIARLYAKQRNVEEAVKNYITAFNKYRNLNAPLSYLVILEAGKLYEEQGNYQKAVDLYKEILKTFEVKDIVEALKAAEKKLSAPNTTK